MRIWLIVLGEPLPGDGDGARLLRGSLIARELERRGHTTVWWSSSFDHLRKRHRVCRDTFLPLWSHTKMLLLKASGYRRNISPARIIDHVMLARKFSIRALREPRPDLILTSLPTVELSREAAVFGRRHRIPVVVDVRDLWPDEFPDQVPRPLRPVARGLLAPLFAATRAACRGATCITGSTKGYVEWGLSRAGRRQRFWDRPFALGYEQASPTGSALRESEAFWNAAGVPSGGSVFRACFFGYLGRQFDLDTVIDAARVLAGRNSPIEIFICGAGDRSGRFIARGRGLEKTLRFPGWLNQAQIWSLMRRSSVGLAPYPSTTNYLRHIPNKIAEYLSAGLPIVSSLQGVLASLLEEERCGWTYPNHNPVALADLLQRLEREASEVRSASERANRLFEKRFVAKNIYRDMVDYLEEVAAAYKAGSIR